MMAQTDYMPCTYCNSREHGGEIFSGLDKQLHKVCWKEDCRAKHKRESSSVSFQEKMKLKMLHKCYYEDFYGYCESKAVKGGTLCIDHLTRRCDMCGGQAFKICKYRGYKDCNKPLCMLDFHSHKNDP